MHRKNQFKLSAIALGVASICMTHQTLAAIPAQPAWNGSALVADAGGPNYLVDNTNSVGIYADNNQAPGSSEGIYIGAQGVTTIFTNASGTSIGTSLSVDGQITGNLTGNVTGNASTATFATTAGAVDAGNLTGTTINSGVTASSLTSVGTLTSLTVSGATTTNGIANTGNITNSGDFSTNGTTNTIGTAGTSTNTITGLTNTITGTTNINTTGTAATTLGNTNAATTVTAHGGNAYASLDNNDAVLAISGGGSYTATNTQAQSAFGANTLTIDNTSINGSVGNGQLAITNATTSLGNTGGGSVSTDATSATMRGTGTLATNGITGSLTGSTGAVTVYNTAQTIADNTTIPTATQATGILAGKSYQNKINGNTFVDGNMYINGTLDYVSSNSATTTVIGTSGTSNLVAGGTTSAGSQIVAKGTTTTHAEINNNGAITMVNSEATQSSAALTMTNGLGNTHGMVVQESQTVISGGTHSSSMTLNDNGATFSNAQTGAPIQLHGVADGTAPFDAVNKRQLDKVATRAYSGVAQIAAMQAVPAPIAGKNYSLGMGGGFYAGQQAIAFGGKANVGEHISVGASVATGFGSSDNMAAAVGAGFSW